jgi:D-glycero-alpha-D-manno-heptose-7-phosphate kinase
MDGVGASLRERWKAKRNLASGASNGRMDRAITRVLEVGASGAKPTEAGCGKPLLVICPVERQRAVRESLTDMREIPCRAGPSRLARRPQRPARRLELRPV